MKYITFDPYYGVDEFNKFLESAKNNNVKYTKYISIRPPYDWYIKVQDKDIPKWVDYKEATNDEIRYLISMIIPVYPSDEWFLYRREAKAKKDFESYISPKIFKDLKTAKFGMIFRYSNLNELLTISKDLNITIWIIGKTQEKGWNLAFTFNPYVKGLIPLTHVLLEKTNAIQYQNPGEFEQVFNYKILVKEKLENKSFYQQMVKSGKYIPVNREVQNG